MKKELQQTLAWIKEVKLVKRKGKMVAGNEKPFFAFFPTNFFKLLRKRDEMYIGENQRSS